MNARRISLTALRGLLIKETYHILRDRRTLVVITLLPILQVILFGYAIRTDVRRVRLAIVDPTPDHTTLALRARFAATDAFHVVAVVAEAAADSAADQHPDQRQRQQYCRK